MGDVVYVPTFRTEDRLEGEGILMSDLGTHVVLKIMREQLLPVHLQDAYDTMRRIGALCKEHGITPEYTATDKCPDWFCFEEDPVREIMLGAEDFRRVRTALCRI